jgi:hypothetical protein
MVTKQPTAKQIAARKLFAARAKAGTLKKSTTKKRSIEADTRHFARGAGTDAAEAALRLAHKVAKRKANPAKTRLSDGKKYVIYRGDDVFAVDLTKSKAIKIAEYQSATTGNRFRVENGVSGEWVYDSEVARVTKKNPASRKTAGYKVEALNNATGKWRRIATFENLVEAKSYANAVARTNRTIAVRVVS